MYKISHIISLSDNPFISSSIGTMWYLCSKSKSDNITATCIYLSVHVSFLNELLRWKRVRPWTGLCTSAQKHFVYLDSTRALKIRHLWIGLSCSGSKRNPDHPACWPHHAAWPITGRLNKQTPHSEMHTGCFFLNKEAMRVQPCARVCLCINIVLFTATTSA